MADQQASLNQLLQWSINASTAGQNSTGDLPTQGLNAEALAELLGGPSDADRMRAAMTAILSPDLPLDNRLTAWDNLEQLIENLDNANNLTSLGLWAPLLAQLLPPGQTTNGDANASSPSPNNTYPGSADPEAREMAAWCVSTAVQNNVKSQEALLAQGGVSRLVTVVLEDTNAAVRKKAVSALSSEVRNFQPGLDELLDFLPRNLGGQQRGVDAGDMEAVDGVIQRLREHAVAARP